MKRMPGQSVMPTKPAVISRSRYKRRCLLVPALCKSTSFFMYAVSCDEGISHCIYTPESYVRVRALTIFTADHLSAAVHDGAFVELLDGEGDGGGTGTAIASANDLQLARAVARDRRNGSHGVTRGVCCVE